MQEIIEPTDVYVCSLNEHTDEEVDKLNSIVSKYPKSVGEVFTNSGVTLYRLIIPIQPYKPSLKIKLKKRWLC